MIALRFRGPLDDESLAVAELWERGCLGVAEEGSDVLAYFEQAVELGEAASALQGRWETAPEVDHVAAYFRGLEPVVAGALVVAPSHTRPTLEAFQQVIWLDPGSAFGTGHHVTTRMALVALDALGVVGKHVLDVGSGSGILTVAADRLGAASAVGVDTDASTLAAARLNADRNRSRARFLHGSMDHPELARSVDVIVANLYAELHATLMPAYEARVVADGDVLLTGILREREALVRDSVPNGLSMVDVRRADEWSLLHLRKRP